MNRFLGVLAIVALVAGGLMLRSSPLVPTPGPSELSLVQVFATNPDRSQAKAHAKAFAGLCDAFAAAIEQDGRMSPPRLTTGKQVADMRRAAREIHFGETSLGAIYPQLGPTLGQFLDSAIGRDPRELDAGTRAKWVAAFRTIAAAAHHAAAQG